MPANSEKQHLSIVICGHVDSGKSTTTGRLLFELGGIPERELEKLKEEAAALGKQSFAFAFYMDRQKGEHRNRVADISPLRVFRARVVCSLQLRDALGAVFGGLRAPEARAQWSF